MFSITYLYKLVSYLSHHSHSASSQGHAPPPPRNSSQVDTMKVSKKGFAKRVAANIAFSSLPPMPWPSLRSSPTHHHNTSPISKC
jgi:hypothetical protein